MTSRLVWAIAIALAMGRVAVAVSAQTPANSAFEVAAVKRNVTQQRGSREQFLPGGRVLLTNNTVRDMILDSFRLQDYQVSGGPVWLTSDHWDIVAQADPGASSDVIRDMIKALLADRFKLISHYEARDLPVYALVRARPGAPLGPSLHRSTVDCAAVEAQQRAPGATPQVPTSLSGPAPVCGTNYSLSSGTVRAGARTMADFARTLSTTTGRAVVDKTGLTGVFDLELSWTPDPQTGASGIEAASRLPLNDGGSLFTALQEQLGLKLESTRAPVDVLMIDHVERPTEN